MCCGNCCCFKSCGTKPRSTGETGKELYDNAKSNIRLHPTSKRATVFSRDPKRRPFPIFATSVASIFGGASLEQTGTLESDRVVTEATPLYHGFTCTHRNYQFQARPGSESPETASVFSPLSYDGFATADKQPSRCREINSSNADDVALCRGASKQRSPGACLDEDALQILVGSREVKQRCRWEVNFRSEDRYDYFSWELVTTKDGGLKKSDALDMCMKNVPLGGLMQNKAFSVNAHEFQPLTYAVYKNSRSAVANYIMKGLCGGEDRMHADLKLRWCGPKGNKDQFAEIVDQNMELIMENGVTLRLPDIFQQIGAMKGELPKIIQEWRNKIVPLALDTLSILNDYPPKETGAAASMFLKNLVTPQAGAGGELEGMENTPGNSTSTTTKTPNAPVKTPTSTAGEMHLDHLSSVQNHLNISSAYSLNLLEVRQGQDKLTLERTIGSSSNFAGATMVLFSQWFADIANDAQTYFSINNLLPHR